MSERASERVPICPDGLTGEHQRSKRAILHRVAALWVLKGRLAFYRMQDGNWENN